jgi:hypothetical protein
MWLPALPLRHLRRHRRARHRRPHPTIPDPRDRHPGERLPLVLRGRRHSRRRPGHRQHRGPGQPPAARPRVRATTSPIDYVALILLLLVILTGIAPTIGVNLLGHGYNYRTTVAPWFRGLFAGSPNVTAIAHAPLIYQIHVPAAWLI